MLSEEYLTSNTAVSYPFKQDQDIPETVKRLFVDALVKASSFSVSLTDIHYDSSDLSLYFRVGGTKYTYIADRSSTKQFDVIRLGCSKFVIDSAFLKEQDSFDFEGQAEFECSCVDVDSASVTSIELHCGDDGRGVPIAILTGDISIMCGYNIEAETDEDESTVTVTAEVGSGLGVVPCESDCSEEDIETNGSPLPTDNGHAVITGDGCYEISQAGSTVQIHGKCVACCQCQMYVDIIDELKKVALRVKESKDDTEERTNTYFDLIHKFEMDGGKPSIDMQLDIAPDASINEISFRKSFSRNTRNYNFFRVSCTITNVSGVPCLITVPDLWDDNEYGNSGMLLVQGYGYDGKKLEGNKHILYSGIQASVAESEDGLLGTRSFTIDPEAEPDSEGGWVVYSTVKGPLIRRRDGETRDYISPGLRSVAGWTKKIDPKKDWTYLSDKALADLNKGENPSYFLEYADLLTDSLVDTNANGGFVMPSGYSFIITNVYCVPSTSINKNRVISAVFRGTIYAPLLFYSRAYNWARSDVTVSKSGNDYVYKNTWTLKGTAVENYDGGGMIKPAWGGIVYYYETGEMKTYYVQNGVVNVGTKDSTKKKR